MVVGGGVNDELDVVGPAKSGVGHFNFLPIVVVVGNGPVEHAKALQSG